MNSLVDVNKKKLCITPFTISILIPDTCPECRFSFRVFLLYVFFQTIFLVSSWSKMLDIFPKPPYSHTYGQFGALSQAPTQPPQTICLICFVFSNELDVKFNTHSYAKEKLRWTFPFWIFRLAIEKAAKKSKSVTKETYFFHDNRERRRRWSSSSVKRQEASADSTHKHKHTLALIFVYCRK